MLSNPTRATTPWSSTFPASADLLVTRTWPIPPSKESIPALAKKMMESDLPKSESAPARKIAIFHPLPLVQKGSAIASNPGATSTTAVPNMQSPGKRCKASCPICAQSTSHPSPVDSDWLEEDWDGKIKDKDKMRKKERKEKPEKTSQLLPTRTDIWPQPRERSPNFGNGSGPSSNTRRDQSESQKRKKRKKE